MRFFGSISTRRLKAIVRREVNEIIRDRLYLALALLVPPVIMIIFSYGLALDVERVPLGVLDKDGSPLSRAYVDLFAESEAFSLAGRFSDMPSLERALSRSQVRAGLVVPAGFARAVYRGLPTSVQMQIDGTISIRAETIRSYGQAVHSRFLGGLSERLPGAVSASRARIEIVSRVWFNEDLRSANFVTPGLVATLLMFYPTLLMSLSIVREKESQSIVALYCSPISKWELLIGKLLPYLVISLLNFGAMFILMLYLFSVPVRGSLPLIATATVIYVISTCGLGLLISVVVRTQISAILSAVILSLLPPFLYSGFFSPLGVANFSSWLIGRFIPATYYLDVLRSVLLKGTGWSYHWDSLLALAGYSVVVYGVAFRCFRKRLG